MSELQPPKSWSVSRGLVEDIFLYTTLAVVISFTSWFLITTQNEVTKSLPKTDEKPVQTFLLLLAQAEKERESNPVTASSQESDPNRINPNYLAYLQAQANLNQKRYDMGAQLVMANMTRKNIGFLIGTLLSLLGCVIIIRRIRNMSLSASGTVSGQQFSLITASPGVLLVVLGSVMVIATILRTDDVHVSDYDPVSPFVTSAGGKKIDEDLRKETDDELKKLEEELKALSNSSNANSNKK